MFTVFLSIYFTILRILLLLLNHDIEATDQNFYSNERIIGGFRSTRQSHPHIVSFEMYGRTFCAGSLITDSTVLTAGHCLNKDIGNYVFRLGNEHRETGGIERTANYFIKHLNYTPSRVNYDIGLVVLNPPVRFNSFIKPIPLAESYDELTEGDVVNVAGWGYTIFNDKYSKPINLNAVYLNYIDFDDCVKLNEIKLDNGMICAGNVNFDKDACVADSGGPLVHDGKLYGIVSWGVDCANGKNPGVYTSVAYYRSYIDKHIFL